MSDGRRAARLHKSSAAFFDGNGATQAWIVLIAWAPLGLAVAALARRAPAPSPWRGKTQDDECIAQVWGYVGHDTVDTRLGDGGSSMT